MPNGKNNKKVGFPPLTPAKRNALEKKFTLDSVAVGNLSDTRINKSNPCVQVVVPLYNPQEDQNCTSYFRYRGVQKLLTKTAQSRPHSSTQGGIVWDKLTHTSHANKYINLRNTHGAGHHQETVAGHYSSPYFQGARPVTLYTGKYGYRRNTPSLRTYPSSFSPPVRSAYHPNNVIY